MYVQSRECQADGVGACWPEYLSGCLNAGSRQNSLHGPMLYIMESLPSELMALSDEPSTLQSQVLVK